MKKGAISGIVAGLSFLFFGVTSQANASNVIHQCFVLFAKMERTSFHYNRNYHEALQLGHEAIQLDPFNPWGYICLASVDAYYNDYGSRTDRKYIRMAKEYATTKIEWAAIYRAEALVYNDPPIYNLAIHYYHQAFRIDREIGNKRGEVLDLEKMGETFSRRFMPSHADLESQLYCYQKALSIGVASQYSKLYDHMGWVYDYEGKHQKALEFYKTALKLWKKDGGSLYTLSSIYEDLSQAYSREGDTAKARIYEEKAQSIENAGY